MEADVYWNHRKQKYSIRIDGCVVGHAEIICMSNVDVHASEARFASQGGRIRLHTWLTGNLVYVIGYEAWNGRQFVRPDKQWDGSAIMKVHGVPNEIRCVQRIPGKPGFFYLNGQPYLGSDVLTITPTVMSAVSAL